MDNKPTEHWDEDAPNVAAAQPTVDSLAGSVPLPYTAPPIPQPAPVINPLMSRVTMPGETFALPSGGLFYGDDVLRSDVVNAEIHVHPMTALDEITIKTPDLLFSGKAVQQIFARCIPQIVNPFKLLSKDVDFLLVCLRRISYGDEMQMEYTHNCKTARKNKYTASMTEFINATKKIDPTTFATKFTVKTSTGQSVHLQPIKFKDFVDMMQVNMADETVTSAQETNKILINSVSSIILKVDEVTDRDMIKEWLNAISTLDFKAINEGIEKTMEWGTEFDITRKCLDCGEPITMTAPMNPLNFFT